MFDKVFDYVKAFPGGARDTINLAMGRSMGAGNERRRLEDLTTEEAAAVWQAFFVALVLAVFVCTSAVAYATGSIKGYKIADALTAAAPVMVGGLTLAIVTLLLFCTLIDRLTGRSPDPWRILRIYAGGIAPALVVAAIGYALLVVNGKIVSPDERGLAYWLVLASLILLYGGAAWGLFRSSLAAWRHMKALDCRRHPGACVLWCRALFAFVVWVVPLGLAGTVLLLLSGLMS
ncbi:hypothetical protein EON82_16100 [bacterium]|nr:MAG: hypothetical protein EON82_16100 [bacterium]